MTRKQKAILVTGGAGYIGSHVCRALAAGGYLPIAYDNLVKGHDWAVKWGPLVQGDLANRELLISTIRDHGIQAVLHFAAYSEVGESVREPALYYANNVGGSLSLLEAMKETGVRDIVFSSTCAVYGLPSQVPIDESHPQAPINPYGHTKKAVEQMLRDFGAAYGLRSVSLRYFNAAGANPDAGLGECHEPETHLIPLALRAATDSSFSLSVFGRDYETPDGTCIRDYVHVDDLADAHVLALRALESAPESGAAERSRAFNLGIERGFSVLEVIQSVERVTGRKVRFQDGPRRPGDPAVLVASSRKAKTELGWKPRFLELDAIVETAWRR